MNAVEPAGWCEKLYREKSAQLVLYGRALGLSHAEAEDVLHETFIALMKRAEPPEMPEHYCLRCFRNRALCYRRSLWRRLSRELESRRWFVRSFWGGRWLLPRPPTRRRALCIYTCGREQTRRLGRIPLFWVPRTCGESC